MGTYDLPRSVKGEGRILFIFTKKAFIFTMAFGFVGIILYLIFASFKMYIVGIILLLLFALTGFIIGTIKIPNMKNIKWATTNAGENIDDVLLRTIKFKQKANKIYIYKGGKTNDD